jgi:hypothetical protein
MARSKAEKIKQAIIQLIIIGLLAGFLPYLLYRAACTDNPNQQRINDQLNPAKTRLEEAPAAPPPADPATPAPAKPAESGAKPGG